MDGFISALQKGGDVIQDQSENIRRLLLAADLPTASIHTIKQIEGWVRDELPTLQRRNAITRAADKVGVGLPTGLRPYDEKAFQHSESLLASRLAGTALAKTLAKAGLTEASTHNDKKDRLAGLIAELEG